MLAGDEEKKTISFHLLKIGVSNTSALQRLVGVSNASALHVSSASALHDSMLGALAFRILGIKTETRMNVSILAARKSQKWRASLNWSLFKT